MTINLVDARIQKLEEEIHFIGLLKDDGLLNQVLGILRAGVEFSENIGEQFAEGGAQSGFACLQGPHQTLQGRQFNIEFRLL